MDKTQVCKKPVGHYAWGMAKKRPGRPSAGRTALLEVRVSAAEKAAFVMAAKKRGMGLSEWVRMVLVENAKP